MRRVLLLLLVTTIGQGNRKFPKCCPEQQILDLHTKDCKASVKADKNILEELAIEVTKDGRSFAKVSLEESLEVSMEKEWDRCNQSSSYILLSSKFKTFNSSQGVLLVDVINQKPHRTADFCIDIAHNYKTGGVQHPRGQRKVAVEPHPATPPF